MKTYEFTGKTLNHNGVVLHQIKKLADGTIGGWIEKEDNLAHDGSWVGDNAKVYNNAIVSGGSKVYGNAEVFDNAEVIKGASISKNAKIYGNARVGGTANIEEDGEFNGKIYKSDL